MQTKPIYPSADVLLLGLFVSFYAISNILLPSVTALAMLLAILYWFLDVNLSKQNRYYWLSKWGLIMFLFCLMVLLPTISYIISDLLTEGKLAVHDGALQIVAASDAFLQGQNPYTVNYIDTPMAHSYETIGPVQRSAMIHYAYLPMTFILTAPFYLLAENTLGWFDLRLLLFVTYLLTLLVATALMPRSRNGMLLLIALGLNPLFTIFFIEGRNDILAIFWIVLCIFLLKQRRPLWAALVLGIACSTKQFAWFFIPFFILFVSGTGGAAQRVRTAIWPTAVLVAVMAVSILPWFFMDQNAFIDDTWRYLSGSIETAYPIRGIGFTALLTGALSDGVINTLTLILQSVFGLLTMGFFLRRQWIDNNLRTGVLGYAALLFVATFFARFFQANYLSFVITIVSIGFFMDSLHYERSTK